MPEEAGTAAMLSNTNDTGNWSCDGDNMTNCNDTMVYDDDMDAYNNPFDLMSVKLVFICLYSLVFLMCFVGNMLIIIVVLKHRKMRTITNFFLANLAVADLCVGIFCVLPNLFVYIFPYWVLGQVMCKLYYFVQAMSYTASVNILTIISVERFFAIIYPLKSKQLATMCILRLAVILVWVIAGAAGIPYLIFYDIVDIPHTNPVMSFCLSKDINMKAYITTNFLFGYVIPLILMTIMYSCISTVLWRSSRKMDSRKTGGFSGKSCLTKTPIRFKKNSNGKSNATITGEQYELSEKSRALVQESSGSQDEHQKLMETNKRKNNAARLLKRMDSSLSEDVETNEDETETDMDFDDDWPGSRSKDGLPRSFLSDIKSSFKIRKTTMNGLKVKSPKTIEAQQPPKVPPPRPVPQVHTKRQHVNAQCKQDNVLLARRRVIRLLIVVIFSFATCVLPYHIRVMWQTWQQPPPSFWNILISPITFVIYYLNSGLNPLFYAFLSDRFRQCLFEVVTCRDYRVRRQMSFTNRTVHSVA